MKRRAFIAAAVTVLMAPPGAAAQQPARVARVGGLWPLSVSASAPMLAGFRQGLRDLGWVEGQNIAIEYRYAEGRVERVPELAAEVVGLNVDLIFASSNAGILAARRATSKIPIVMVTLGGEDIIASGVIASLARPGGNLTGVIGLAEDSSGKRLQLLKEAVPGVSSVAVLVNPADVAVLVNPVGPPMGPAMRGIDAAARALGTRIQVVEARDPAEIANAFQVMNRERVGALLVLESILFSTHRRRIMDLRGEKPAAGYLWTPGARVRGRAHVL